MRTKKRIIIGLVTVGLYLASTLVTYVRIGSLYIYDMNFIGLTIRRDTATNTWTLLDINAFIIVHILACLGIAWALVTAVAYVGNRNKKS